MNVTYSAQINAFLMSNDEWQFYLCNQGGSELIKQEDLIEILKQKAKEKKGE
jgi:hypothetical protein